MENVTKEMPKVEDPSMTKTQTPVPEGWQFKDDAVLSLHWKEYSILMASLSPFEPAIAILNTLKNKAINEGKLLPFYPEDVTKRNEFGQVMEIRKDFGSVKSETKSNAVTLNDLTKTN